MNNRTKQDLLNMFADRVRFDKTERVIYSHDVGAIPKIVKPVIGNTTPDAVVQPENELELISLVQWASGEKIPLTPRGKATSGYGGAVPVKKGIVVDFHRMKNIISIDEENRSAEVEAGITFENLDRQLSAKNLTLRLYPSSYPSATVGGWFAQGGAGIGSYQYGYFAENVISARVVLPTGAVEEISGEKLDLISEAEGITGFISSLTIRLMPLDEIAVTAVSCPDAEGFNKFISEIAAEDLPVWTILFINPKMAALRNQSPVRTHLGHAVEEKITLPETYVVILAYKKGKTAELLPRLEEFAKQDSIDILDNHIADHEWENRFNLMLVKRLGPSLVPSEVVVPLEHIDAYLNALEKKVKQLIVKEGIIVKDGKDGKPEVVLLGFIPSDQRKFSYNFIFALSMSIIRLAKKFGGRPYTTGMFFSKEAKSLLGEARLRKLKSYKKEIDPKGIMNPKKVIKNGLIGFVMGFAEFFEPLIRPFGNMAAPELGERIGKSEKGIPGDVIWYAYSCSQCGYCVDSCTQFHGRGWESQSPRGKWYWLREYLEGRAKWDQAQVDSFLVCTTCEVCDTRCSASLPIEPSWMKLRGQMIHKEKRMTIPPFEMMAAATKNEGNIWAGYRKNRSKWFPEDLLEKHGPGVKSQNIYFAGCTASYVENDIAMATVRLLDKTDVDFTYLGEKESCCAIPMLVSGKWGLFEATMRKNIKAVKESGADTVISSCPACDMMWRSVYPEWSKKLGIEYGITAKHYSEVVSEKIKAGEVSFPDNNTPPVTVTWHDSCHIGRASGVYEPPRDLIKALPNVNLVEMEHNREEAFCCGSVLTLIKEPAIAADIGKFKLDEAVDAGAEKVLALCPCCQVQMRITAGKKNIPVEIVDLAHFAAASFGYEFPDPNPEIAKQWGVFDAMIGLMSPQGFADLMGTMWPELIAAMPFKMGGMMKFFGKIPFALNLMKPMFPVLFPILLPKMMPKLLPVMLDRIGKLIKMPDYMEEQMPGMMPDVMDNLMPHMIGDLVPLVTQPMIDYLQGKEK